MLGGVQPRKASAMRHVPQIALATAMFLAGSVYAGSAKAAGDFPLASCSGWSGTVVDISGVDGKSARMDGIVTKADLREYCERDPGGETTQTSGSLTVGQCVDKYWKEERGAKMRATADCKKGTLTLKDGSQKLRTVRFPLGTDAETSCASGMPPLMAQFRMLCPTAAKRMGVE
jgi:hypothetical protein